MEKSLKVEIKLSVGEKSEKVFFASNVNEDSSGVGFGQKGTWAILLTLSGEEDLQGRAENLVREFEEEYLGNQKSSVLNSLEAALKSIQEKTAKEPFKVEVVCAVIWGLVLYVGKIADCEIYLFRGNLVKPIQFNFVASGMIRDADTLALTNSFFAKDISIDELALLLGREKLSEVKEKLDSIQKEIPGSVTLLLRASLEEANLTEVPITFVDAERKRFEFNQLRERGAGFLGKVKSAFEKAKVVLMPVFNRILPLLTKAMNFFHEPWRKRKPGEIFDEKKRKRARLLQAGTVLGLFLLMSLVFSFTASSNEKKIKASQKLVSQAKSKIASAKESLLTDPSRSQAFLAEATELLRKAPSSSETKSLETEVSGLQKETKKIYAPSNLEQIGDLQKLGFTQAESVLSDQWLMSLDVNKNLLAKTDLQTKASQLIESGKNSFSALAADKADVYLLTKDGTLSFDIKNSSFNSILKGEDSWKKITDTAIFSSNLYVLDSAAQQIWKHIKASSSLSAARTYLADKVDLSNATSLTIDGNIWIGTSDGAIFKFLGGKRQDFSLTGRETPLSISKLFTSEDTNNLYILDTKAGQVVIFDKTGNYLASYETEQLKTATSLVVVESEKTIYFDSATKIFKCKIK